jgi:AcrR family transcriptional regulator
MAQTSHREQLLEGAIRCLQEKGYARTTARDIAAAANANLASIGYHFGSKEALLNEALMRSFEAWTEQLVERTLAQSESAPLERLLASWKVMLASFEEVKPLLVAFMESIAQAQHSDELRAQLAAHYHQIRETVADTVRTSLGPDAADNGADAEVVASFLIAVCDGFTIQWLLDPQRTPDGQQLADSLTAALLIGLQGAGVLPLPDSER